MRLAVIGRTGQVAQSLIERGAAAGCSVIAVGRPDFDLADEDEQRLCEALRACAPHAIVNCATYTAVDKAEREPDLALAINVRGAGHVAVVSG